MRLYYDSDDDLGHCNEVIYEGKKYSVGNRGHNIVELYDGKTFFKCVNVSSVYSEISEKRFVEQTMSKIKEKLSDCHREVNDILTNFIDKFERGTKTE